MRITDLPQLYTASFDDFLYIIDVNDTSSFLSGSSRKIILGDLLTAPSVTASFAKRAISASYAYKSTTASYALNATPGTLLYTGSTYPITSSWALNSGTRLYTGSTYPITSSWAINSGTKLYTGSTYPITSSWAINSGTKLYTGSKYPITSSWATNVISASYAFNFGNSVTQSFNNSSTWTFTHNLGERTVIIQAYNTLYNQIIPQSIILDNSNTARLKFPVSSSGFAIATRAGVRIFSSSYSFLHTGSTYPITSSWSRKALTASVALRLLNSDSVSASFSNSTTWNFTHNLDSRPVLIQAYNNSFNQIIPQNIILSNSNTAQITFPVSSSGYAIATRSGLRTITSGPALATTGSNTFNNTQTIRNGFLILSYVSSSLNFANDVSASLGGVPLGGVYRNGNVLQIRIT